MENWLSKATVGLLHQSHEKEEKKMTWVTVYKYLTDGNKIFANLTWLIYMSSWTRFMHVYILICIDVFMHI